MARTKNETKTEELREQILHHFSELRIPLQGDDLDRLLRRADEGALSHLAFLNALIAEQANLRRERSAERRIRLARFPERKTLEDFDWTFNDKYIDRAQIEEMGTADFVRRGDNIVLVGQSGVGKSHLIQANGLRACAAGCSVLYTTSASLITTLTAALADKTLPTTLRLYSKPKLLVIDEFGFDRVERAESPDAASLIYKVIEARYHHGSIVLATNIDFDAWGEYLGDAPLSMALLDRLVENAIIVKIPTKAKSWRAAKAERRKRESSLKPATKKKATKTKPKTKGSSN